MKKNELPQKKLLLLVACLLLAGCAGTLIGVYKELSEIENATMEMDSECYGFKMNKKQRKKIKALYAYSRSLKMNNVSCGNLIYIKNKIKPGGDDWPAYFSIFNSSKSEKYKRRTALRYKKIASNRRKKDHDEEFEDGLDTYLSEEGEMDEMMKNALDHEQVVPDWAEEHKDKGKKGKGGFWPW